MKKHTKLVFFIYLSILVVILILITIKIKEKITPDICQVNGKINSTLEILLPISCSNGKLFNPVSYGYANVRGEIVLLDPSWIHTTPFNDHYFAVVSNNQELDAIINKKGKVILDFYYDEITYLGDKSYFLQKFTDDKIEYYLATYKNGKMNITETDYKFIYDFREGFAAVISKNSDKMGYIDQNGNLKIPAVYDKNPMISHQFINNLSVVIYKGQYGVINSNKEIVVPFIYDYIQPQNEGELFLKYQRNDKWGLMNQRYQEIIPPNYESIGDHSEGIVAVSFDNENFGFLDVETNKMITNFLYKKANTTSFTDYYNYYQYGYAVVAYNDASYNLINRLGKITLPKDYLGIKVINKDYVLVKDSETFYYLIDLNTFQITNIFEAQDILVYKGYSLLAICSEMNEDGATVYKLYDLNGEELIKGLKVYEYMVEMNIEGHNFLYLNGEIDGHLFSSYINSDNHLLFNPFKV